MAWELKYTDTFGSFTGWTTESGTATASGGLLTASSDARIRNNYTVATADAATEIQLSDADNYTFRIFARIQDTAGNNSYACYAARASATTAYIYLQKYVGGGFSNLAGDLYNFTNGDILRLEVQGTTLRAIRNTTTLFTVTDSSHSAAGKAGVFLEVGTTLDNFKIYEYSNTLAIAVTDTVTVSEPTRALNIYEPVKPEATPDTVTVSESVNIEIEPESLNPSVSDTVTVSESSSGFLQYLYYATITIDADQVGGSSGSHTDFPILIAGTYDGTGCEPDLRVTGSGGNVTNSNGYDIIFTSDIAGTNKLDHEIEKYVSTTGEIVMWVRIPTLDAVNDTTIYMFYGSSSVTTSQQNVSGVWDANFVGVYHLNTDPTGAANEVVDSSGSNHGVGVTVANIDLVTGKVGSALDFSGGYIDLGTRADHNITSSGLTVEAWAMPDSSPGNSAIVAHDLSTGRTWNMHGGGSQSLTAAVFIGSTEYAITRNSVFTNGQWHHVVMRHNGTYINSWVNGSKGTDTAASGSIDSASVKSLIASYYEAGGFLWPGKIDEVRIHKTARSDDWITTSYNTQNSPSTFYAMGCEYGNGNGPQISASDSITLSESVSIYVYILQPDLLVSKTETITLSESVTVSVSDEAYASETVTVTDTPTIELSEPTLFVQPTETITVSEYSELSEPFSPPPEISVSEGVAYSGGFKYRRQITINEVSLTQTNYPFFFTGTFTYLKTVGNGGKVDNANGYDIAFSLNADGSDRLAHEIRTYEASTGRVEIYVLLPTVTTGTTLYLFYGSEAVTSSLENKPGVWGDWTAVYHLNVNGTGAALEFKDSSGNNHHGTAVSGKVPTYTTTAGKFASGNVFNDSAIDLPQLFTGTQNFWRIFTVASQSTIATDQHLVSADEASYNNDIRWGTFDIFGGSYQTDNESMGIVHIDTSDVRHSMDDGFTLVVNTFYNFLVHFSDTSGSGYAFHRGINGSDNYGGVSYGSSLTSLPVNATDKWMIGYNNQLPTQYWRGTVNEIWIVGSPTTPLPFKGNWFKALHRNIDSPGTFFTVGTESTGTAVGILDLSFLYMEREVAASESVTVSESVSLSISLPVQATETITVTDTPTMFFPSPFPTPNVSDNLTISELVTVSNPIDYLTASEAIVITDTPTINAPYTIPLSVSVAESILVTESVNLSAPDENVSVSDTITISEVAGIAFSTDLGALQNVFILENVVISVSDPQIVASDTISISELTAGLTDIAVYASETITVSEAYTLIPPVEVYAFDAATIFDEVTMVQPLEVSALETIAVGDLANISTTLNTITSETITVSEAFEGYNLIQLYLEEMVSAIDINAVIVREPPDFKPELSDTVSVSEGIISVAVLGVGALGISVMDTVTITEPNTNVVSPFPPIEVSDSVTVSDFPNAVTPTVLFVNVSDTIQTLDTVTPFDIDIIIPPASHSVNVYEVIVVTESHLVDRDIWGPNIGEGNIWDETSGPSTIYTEVPDPTTDWREVIEHER